MHSSSRSHNISNQLHFSNTKEKKILSGPHWKFNDVHNHLIMRKQVQVIIQVIMFQQLITSNICDNCKHRLITLLCFSHLKARFNTYSYWNMDATDALFLAVTVCIGILHKVQIWLHCCLKLQCFTSVRRNILLPDLSSWFPPYLCVLDLSSISQ